MAATGVDMVGTVLATDNPHDLFGRTKELGKSVYARLARSVHPDRNNDPRASEAFDKLQKLWESMDSPTKPAKATVVTSKLHVYELGSLIGKTSTANLYNVTWDAGHGEGLMKITRKPTDMDLATAEVRALKKLREVPDQFQMYHPRLLDSFRFRDNATKKDRATLVTDRLDGFYSMAQIKQAYPYGVTGRDAAWMFRRLLVAVGTANDVGLVHGSVVPENVMIHPAKHGITLVDWTTSVETGQPLKSVHPDYYDWLPSAALKKKPVDYTLDLRFAAKTMRTLVRPGDKNLRAFLNGCMVSSVPTAAELLEEFDELLQRMYGKRTFHPFVMPTAKDK
jgi:serine/threonine protein kinase